ncbi:hypothetical protein K432DRAFT_376758 [Lepidopterella palustris CBS 459.81]|uniref:Cell wall mannoprotein PIR1-like C-terminal domain-containing protein n=1 Tax=Lepidopterella palustris CBS 459.81 TaxID=1314670 RepID=A0A8E2EMX5_9PEZI|nr:hypothetical protein K432DRAFT_376758 [Lepidopterella palustris CBS 459.81]
MKYNAAFLALVAIVKASPFPQGVTIALPPSASIPSGCSASYSGSFGIAVVSIAPGNIATSTSLKSIIPVTTSPPVVASSTLLPSSIPSPSIPSRSIPSRSIPSRSISSQSIPSSSTPPSAAPVSQISDGQPQVATTLAPVSVQPVSQISDGQIQAATTATVLAVSQISDGQIQAPKSTVLPVSQISDGQPQAPKTTLLTSTLKPISQISDGQPQAPTHTANSTSYKTHLIPAAKAKRYAFPQAAPSPAPSPQFVTCASNDTLELTLSNGVLKDAIGRTGYIASNYQFQFDDPPQAGAIYTSGFSVCSNGSLALGGSAVWYQCLSGDFYNLYDRYWAAQCTAVLIDVLTLKNCSSS